MSATTAPHTTGPAPAEGRVRQQLTTGSRDVAGATFRTVLQAALAISLLILVTLLVQVLADGSGVLTSRFSDFMTGDLRSLAADAGVSQGLRGSFWIAAFVVVLSFPIGIGAAIYLEEYAPRNRTTNFIDVNIRNLAGVPSVVYGILGLIIFVKALRGVTGGNTVMAGGITLAILVLPIVIITSAEAIRAVPDSLREAGYGVGATRWEVVRGLVLPYASPGILTGTVLSLARALGEAAPLILVGAITGRLASDFSFFDPAQLTERFTAMPIVITGWTLNFREGFDAIAAAAIIVLLVFVLLANTTAILLRNRFESKRG